MQSIPFQLQSDYRPMGDQITAINALTKGLQAGKSHQTLLGVTGSGKTYTMANVIQESARPAIIIAHNKTLAAQLYGEFKQFFPHNAVEYFVSYYDYYQPEAYVPASDTYIAKDLAINDHIEQMRLSATKSLLERRDTIVVATVSAIYGIGAPETYANMSIKLTPLMRLSPQDLAKQLVNIQYARNPQTLSRGQFRLRGDVLDIFPAESETYAIRLEFMDDELESIRPFDPLLGTVFDPIRQTIIYPATHYVTPQSEIDAIVSGATSDLETRLTFFREKGNARRGATP